MGALEPQFLAGLATAANLALPDAASDEDAFRRQLARAVAAKTRDEWVAILERFDCCCEPVLELDEVAAHPLHRAHDLFFEIPDGDSDAVLQAHAAWKTRQPPPAPALGQDNAEVFREYGVDDA